MISSSFKGTIHQTLASMPVNFNEFMIGIGYGWIAPILIRLQESTDVKLKPTTEESSWIASLHEIARTLGPLFSALLLDNIGRKYTIIICSVLFLLTWLIIVFATTIFQIFVSRILFGITIGMNDGSSSIYLTENCSPNIRGIIGSFLPISFYAGVFVEYTLATYLPYRTVAIVNTTIGMLTVFSIFNLKETPYFLMMKGRRQEAENNLIWLKGYNATRNDIDAIRNVIKSELEKIEQNVETEKLKKSSNIVLFAARENYRSTLVVLVIYMLTMATGYSSINSYASSVFASTDRFTSNEFTILLGVIQFLAVCVSPFIMERYDRRTLILISFLGMALSHGCSSVIYYVQIEVTDVPYFPLLIFMSVTAYSCIFAAIYPAIFIIRGELLPMSVKAIGSCIAIIGNSSTGFATAWLFPTITNNYGIYVNFCIYTVVSAGAFVYIYFLLPETRGKSLTDIQKSFKKV